MKRFRTELKQKFSNKINKSCGDDCIHVAFGGGAV